MGCISERELEVDLFLSILADIKKPHINLIEAGAGWGEWCMALAGVVKNNIIPIAARNYFAIGVEGDFKFYDHMRRNFKFNHLRARAVYGAIANHNDWCRFNVGFLSKNNCGGSMSFKGTFKGSTICGRMLGLLNSLIKKSILVEQWTIDFLIREFTKRHLDILHIDVQGSELLVFKGAEDCFKRALIDYILIGTHAPNLHSKVKAMLLNTHVIIAEAVPNQVNHIDGMPPVWIAKGQDGLILFKRKGL